MATELESVMASADVFDLDCMPTTYSWRLAHLFDCVDAGHVTFATVWLVDMKARNFTPDSPKLQQYQNNIKRPNKQRAYQRYCLALRHVAGLLQRCGCVVCKLASSRRRVVFVLSN